jgi:hypothetical protein
MTTTRTDRATTPLLHELGEAALYCEHRQGMWTRAMAAGLDNHDVDGETLVLWAEEALMWELRQRAVEDVVHAYFGDLA